MTEKSDGSIYSCNITIVMMLSRVKIFFSRNILTGFYIHVINLLVIYINISILISGLTFEIYIWITTSAATKLQVITFVLKMCPQ